MTRKQARQSAATDRQGNAHAEEPAGTAERKLGRGFGEVAEQALRGLRRPPRERRESDREIIAAIFGDDA